jgi:subtilisin family serine protease
MDFEGKNWLDVYQPAGAKRGIYVNWNEFGVCGTSDLDAWLVSESGVVVGRSEVRQSSDGDSCSPVERLTGTVDEAGWYRLIVFGRRVAAASLDVDITATAGTVDPIRPEHSIVDPGVSPHALTVGAVRASDYLRGDVEDFSSRGPSWAGLPKPDIVGPNGLSTSTYGPAGFFGTSAATPAVAGAVGLVLSREPELGAIGAARKLRAAALRDEPLFSAPNPRWGAGKARLFPLDATSSPCGQRPLRSFLFAPILLAITRRRRGSRR